MEVGHSDMDRSDFPSTQPVIIGGHGGSGTRAGVGLLREAGIWMGGDVDPKREDSVPMRYYLNRWFNKIIRSAREGQGINEDAFSEFLLAISTHLENIPDVTTPWGWKNPRNMWLIPFYAQVFPGLKFIHMIRDGRDMVTSKNETLLRSNGRTLLADNWTDDKSLRQFRLWTYGNELSRHHGISVLGEKNYCLIRYEDMCMDPRPVIENLFEFLGVQLDDPKLARCLSIIRPSPRMGCWREHEALINARLEAETVNVLKSFGYPV